MADHTGACGCIRHADHTWTLCADCSARIGKAGTCLVCDGPADEWWTVDQVPDSRGCSPECARLDAKAIYDWKAI